MYDFSAYYEAGSVQHAIDLLLANPNAKIIAGGSDVLIKIRENQPGYRELVCIQGLDELRGVFLDDDETIRILPLTCFTQIIKNPLILKLFPVLSQAVSQVGGVSVRNIGTIGGNICNGATGADSASTLLAYDAVLELTGASGIRRLPLREFFISPGKVALNPAEILTAILIPKSSYSGYFGHYIKYSIRNAMDIATINCSCNIKLSFCGNTVENMRMAFGAAGPVPVRVCSAETYAKGTDILENFAQRAAKHIIADIKPRSSPRASKEFRTHLARELARRAINECINLARGKEDKDG